jgi:hypothetical protein
VAHFYHNLTLSQFRWGAPENSEILDSITNNPDQFAVNVWQWVEAKIIPQVRGWEDTSGDGRRVDVQDYAVNVIRKWGDVFCGFGAYSVQEVFFRAGLSCYYLLASLEN